MQVSKKDINKKIEKKIFKSLYQVLADLKKVKEVEMFLNDVLSETEKTVLAKRLGIAYYLNNNKSYEQIREELRVSSATIASVQKWMEKGGEGLSLALKTIEADEWAGEMANKISDSVKKVFKR
ncbi:MAG: YerC/YecD family TrpR-related protein [Patescibacteria group bacterium]|nr:YerC/YecD family TrpR-related protein [Patescibacteria group bacterium]